MTAEDTRRLGRHRVQDLLRTDSFLGVLVLGISMLQARATSVRLCGSPAKVLRTDSLLGVPAFGSNHAVRVSLCKTRDDCTQTRTRQGAVFASHQIAAL